MAKDLSLRLNRSFTDASNALANSFNRLSSGQRINSAKDDAAGLQIADQLAASIKISSKGSENISYSQAALQIADSAVEQVNNIGARLSELAEQSANGTLSDTQRSALQDEFSQLTQEAQRIAATTEFNGVQLLNNNSLTTQVGQDGSSSSQISTPSIDFVNLTSTLSSLSVADVNSARTAIDAISSFVSTASAKRGEIGAADSRLDSARENNDSQRLAYTSAEAQIRNVDVADEAAKLVSNDIRQKVNSALQAQANNLNKDSVLRLLQ